MIAEVRLWGRTIGAVSQREDQDWASFQYTPEFARSGIEVSPLAMPLGDRVYSFPNLARATFRGLPGLLADSLPDRFGHRLIDAWLASQGRTPESFGALERLCYIGSRGMGALEFVPSTGPKARRSTNVDLDALVRLASEVLSERADARANIDARRDGRILDDILRVGTSAGGARAKAVIAWNPATGEVRSGQVPAGEGFGYWLLKFDGVAGNKDKEAEDPQGFCAIEYAYHLMAVAAGIEMTECRLLEENGRRHFVTRRFDRGEGGEKFHLQSLGALAHFDYNQAGAHSYEEAFLAMRRLELPMKDMEQQFRRMAFNVVARNQDDHVKNIAFLMDKQGRWRLSPAFDVTYSYNLQGTWTAVHQMSIHGKRDGFAREDFRAAGKSAVLKRGLADEILDEVCAAVTRWTDFAEEARVAAGQSEQIRGVLRVGELGK